MIFKTRDGTADAFAITAKDVFKPCIKFSIHDENPKLPDDFDLEKTSIPVEIHNRGIKSLITFWSAFENLDTFYLYVFDAAKKEATP